MLWVQAALNIVEAMHRRWPHDAKAQETRRRAHALAHAHFPRLDMAGLLAGTSVPDIPQLREDMGPGIGPDALRANAASIAFSALLDERRRDEATLQSIVTTVHEKQLGQVRRLFNFATACWSALGVAIELCERGTAAEATAIRIAELEAECRSGAVIRRAPLRLDQDTAYVDMPFGDTQDLDPLTLRETDPRTVFVWVNAYGRSLNAGRELFYSCGVDTSTGRMWAAQFVLKLIPLAGSTATRVVVVPNHAAWSIPWSLILPQSIAEVYVCPSVGAMRRRRSAPSHATAEIGRRRVLGLFDSTLSGARLELDADGAEYRMLLPDREATPAMVFGLRVPPVVVLGSCWSAQAADTPDAVATAIGCLAAGADLVVGGLWAINDAIAGTVLAEAYHRFAHGAGFAAALRAGCLGGDAERRMHAAGLSITGFPAVAG